MEYLLVLITFFTLNQNVTFANRLAFYYYKKYPIDSDTKENNENQYETLRIEKCFQVLKTSLRCGENPQHLYGKSIVTTTSARPALTFEIVAVQFTEERSCCGKL